MKNMNQTTFGKALSHPLRVTLLMTFRARGRMSPREATQHLAALPASEFGPKTALGNVSYHVRVLFALKLIKLAKKTPRRGAVEHYYELTAAGEKVIEAIGAIQALEADVGAVVELVNNDGDKRAWTGWGKDPNAAIIAAEDELRALTGDESWVMSEWRAAS